MSVIMTVWLAKLPEPTDPIRAKCLCGRGARVRGPLSQLWFTTYWLAHCFGWWTGPRHTTHVQLYRCTDVWVYSRTSVQMYSAVQCADQDMRQYALRQANLRQPGCFLHLPSSFLCSHSLARTPIVLCSRLYTIQEGYNTKREPSIAVDYTQYKKDTIIEERHQ